MSLWFDAQLAWELDHQNSAASILAEQISLTRERLAAFEQSAVKLAARIVEIMADREAATRIVESLRAKLAAEHEKLAPKVDKHRKEIERLQRRLATVRAYHPEQRSEVLTNPEPGARPAPSLFPETT